MPGLAKLAGAAIVASLALMSLASADGRDELISCQVIIDRAAQSAQNSPTTGPLRDEAKLQRCRQIVRDWTLRDSRMSVDEQGRALR